MKAYNEKKTRRAAAKTQRQNAKKQVDKELFTLCPVEVGENELWEQFGQISDFVVENWGVLYEGACRLKLNRSSDYYATERIYIESEDRKHTGFCQTRLHKSTGLKYANGIKYTSDNTPTEEDLICAIKDVQMLLEAAAKPIKSKIQISFS